MTRKRYSSELKVKVLKEYLEGNIRPSDLVRKYDLSSRFILRDWIRKYRKGGFDELYVDNRGKSSTGRPKKNNVNYDLMTDKEKISYLEMEVEILKKLKEIQKGNQK